MSFIDESGRLWGRINIIDLLIVVLIVTGVAGLTYRRVADRIAPTLSAERVEMEVEFMVAGVRQATIDVLEPGTVFYHTQTNERIGTLIDIRVEPAEVFTVLPSGEMIQGLSETRFDVYMVIRGTGRVTPNVILMGNNQEIRIGTRVPLKSQLASVSTTVMAINAGLD